MPDSSFVNHKNIGDGTFELTMDITAFANRFHLTVVKGRFLRAKAVRFGIFKGSELVL